MLNCERTESSIVELIAQPVLVTVSSGGFRGGGRGVRPPKIRKAYVMQR